MRRYVLAGAPGAGKTAILRVLQSQGFAVVEEAATDVIAAQQRRGVDQPWLSDDFIDAIVDLQRQRQRAAAAAEAQVYDRSPVCTLALARFLGRPVTAALTAEIDRIMRDKVYEREVFFVRPIGSVELTAARRISYQESLAFEEVHEAAYQEHGFEIVDVPPAAVAERAARIADHIAKRA